MNFLRATPRPETIRKDWWFWLAASLWVLALIVVIWIVIYDTLSRDIGQSGVGASFGALADLVGVLALVTTGALIGWLRPRNPVGWFEQHLTEVRRLEKEKKTSVERLAVAVEASGTGLTDIYGVGPVVAGLLIGYTGNVTRFPTRHHYAAYKGTAPIEMSSGGKKRHRLNPEATGCSTMRCT